MENPPLAGLSWCLASLVLAFCLGLEGQTHLFGALSVGYQVAERVLAWELFLHSPPNGEPSCARLKGVGQLQVASGKGTGVAGKRVGLGDEGQRHRVARPAGGRGADKGLGGG